MGTNVDVPLQFGSYWQISNYASNYTDAPDYSQGVANAYYDFYMNGYTSPITTEYSSSYFGGNLLGEGDRRTLAGTSTTLQGGLSDLSSLANLQSYAADRQQISAKFDALGDYQKTYANLNREAVSIGFELGGVLNTSLQAVTSSYDTSLWTSCGTYNTAMQTAVQNDTTLSTLLSSAQSSMTAELNLQKAYASNFSDYQVDWRTTLNTGTSDITWATNVGAARTAYMNAICGEISDYASTVYGALEDYADALTSASWAYSNSIFSAAQTHSMALSTAENLYINTVYNTQKAATLSYYDAAISELTQTIDLESKQKADEAEHCNLLATTQAEIIDNLFEDLEERIWGFSMLIIKNYYIFRKYRYYDFVSKIFIPIEQDDADSSWTDGSLPLSGFYSNVSRHHVILFRKNAVLVLSVDSEEFPFDELVISSHTVKTTVDCHHQIFWIRHLTITLHDNVIMDTDYDDIVPTFEEDFTPFMEAENFDFGLFLKNLSKDKKRQARLFRVENFDI